MSRSEDQRPYARLPGRHRNRLVDLRRVGVGIGAAGGVCGVEEAASVNYYEHYMRETPRERQLRYRKERSDRMAASRKLGTHTSEQWQSLVRRFDGRCVRCGSTGRVEKDHIVPVYQGGSDAIENLQPLCARCNASKGPDSTNWVRYRETHGFEADE